MNQHKILAILFIFIFNIVFSQNKRARDYGIKIGVLKTGKLNAITDVKGVKVGHTTLIKGDSIRTGVTAILPHSGNIFQSKVPAAIYLGNGFGKLAGYSQVKELGNIETPIILTNTLSVPEASNALITYTLKQKGNENIFSVNPIVGETNDGWLNDIRGRHVNEKHVLAAINNAKEGTVEEGNVGAGTGTICFQYKGGIGTSSRIIPKKFGAYTVGVLVQTNYGGVLQIDGVPIAKELDNYPRSYTYDVDGSCMIVVMTDAPLSARNLERLAKRAIMGLAKTGGIASNGSGDYVIAVSTAKENFIPYRNESMFLDKKELKNGAITPLFLAVIEATEEAIINSLFAAKTMTGRENHTKESLPIDDVIKIMKRNNRIDTSK
ncbi:DmpA family aminopeptidase [Polaribacter sargassicola]|uniref:DmpA family aminopeptidase n=1 Tax=Polaribacter sargassicola TaxID=2836891 RepID=UPI001F2AEA09|nr:P1 family peptidase [Polaribacter sp. DS7-9]MCG1036522.1 P1 family peptidase [Polaribacter sp. DS7-9]